jgi:fructose-bisphosphate aldolase class I
LAADLVPIIEPEVDIQSSEKGEAEELLRSYIAEQLAQIQPGHYVILKLSLPDVNDFYADLVRNPKVLRVVALSGGYGQKEADERLAANHGVIASFSRALTEGLSVHQSNDEFDAALKLAIERIFDASLA